MTLTAQIVRHEPLGSAGNSGSPIERVVLADGRELVLKRVSPEWDWMSRASGDRGRLGLMWTSGLFDRVPAVLDHATVAVEEADDGWNVFMRDVSDVLVAPDARVGRVELRRILSAAYELHDAFWGERFDDLCSLEDRYALFSPATMSRERALGNQHGEIISRGWDAFAELVSSDVASAVLTIADRPAVLAERLAAFDHTLVHGDLRLGNLGFAGDRVVLIDWGERVGSAPAAVELAWFIGFDAYRLDVAPAEVIGAYRAIYGDRADDAALQLALIGGLVQLGGIMSLWVVSASDDTDRRRYREHLSWWDTTVASALETWSPT